MSPSTVSLGPKILAGAASVLIAFLVMGFLLPSSWEAEASALIEGSPEAVFDYLDSPEGWQAWTPWPESGVERSGPDRGAGASFGWDDPEMGSGTFVIGEVRDNEQVAYSVQVGDGAMRTEGVLTIAPEAGGVRVVWREEGDLGWNPLMGYWALSMERAQGEELAKALERLEAVANGREPEMPVDPDVSGP